MSRSGKLQKTSVQLAPALLDDMDQWPGASRSEAIRLSIERARYFATLDAERIADIASEYSPILRGALEDFDYGDFRTVARALPEIVRGYVAECNDEWRYKGGDRHQLHPSKLVELLSELDTAGRIGILDCIVAERQSPIGQLKQEIQRREFKSPEGPVHGRFMNEPGAGAHGDQIWYIVKFSNGRELTLKLSEVNLTLQELNPQEYRRDAIKIVETWLAADGPESETIEYYGPS